MKKEFPLILLIVLFAFSVTIKANGISTDTLQQQKPPELTKKAPAAQNLPATGGDMASSSPCMAYQLQHGR